jgi:hypothetical protein
MAILFLQLLYTIVRVVRIEFLKLIKSPSTESLHAIVRAVNTKLKFLEHLHTIMTMLRRRFFS